MGLSDAVKKSFWKCFLFKLDNYGELYLCLTNSFIHPRNITCNKYHSLYHIIRFKVVQKLLGLRYSFGAQIRRIFCVCLFETCPGESPRWNFISFVSTKMPDALDDKFACDSPEQLSTSTLKSHEGQSIKCQPSGNRIRF